MSKIQTADNVFGIFTSRAMRERGRYQLQLMKTRNSGGVGQKIDLEFDIDSLRIRDLADDEEYQEFNKRKSTIYEGLKRNSLNTPAEPDPNADPKEGDSVGKVKADVDSTLLRSFITNLGQDEE